MIRLAITFFIVAIIAGILGFGGIAVGAAAIAKFLFWGAIILFLLFLALGLFRPVGRRW